MDENRSTATQIKGVYQTKSPCLSKREVSGLVLQMVHCLIPAEAFDEKDGAIA